MAIEYVSLHVVRIDGMHPTRFRDDRCRFFISDYSSRYILFGQLYTSRVQVFEVSIPPSFPVHFRLPLDLTDMFPGLP